MASVVWNSNENHCWVFDINDLLVERLNKVVIDTDARINA